MYEELVTIYINLAPYTNVADLWTLLNGILKFKIEEKSWRSESKNWMVGKMSNWLPLLNGLKSYTMTYIFDTKIQ